MTEETRISNAAIRAIPRPAPDIVEWAEENVQLPSSARSKFFNASVSPWIIEPMRRLVDRETRIVTFMKPVQSAGSVLGEVVILYWIMFWRGFLQYNWSNDKRADERWKSRIEPVFKACSPVAERINLMSYTKDCEIDFGNVFFRQQGAFIPDNLDSDTVPLQINEEVHSWEPGHLKKARNRSTAVWNFKSGDISNAGNKGDQLDQEWRKGTMQEWLVKCPGCKEFHTMRIRWEDDKPLLGGLRYDAEGARLGRFSYDYNKIRRTIYYQFPCGFIVHNDDVSLRRKLSLSGQYSSPTNIGAEISHRSYTFEAVVVDYIDWMILIKDKHDALRARAYGDPAPFIRYKQERECIPYDPEDVPIINILTLTKDVKKNREGLPPPRLRAFALDRQRGKEGEGRYWWLLIRDFKIFFGALRSVLVYESRLNTDTEVVSVLDEYECDRWKGCADSGDDTDYVYNFCMRYGINAVKGGKEQWFIHEGGARRIYSEERPLHSMLNCAPMFPYVQTAVRAGAAVSEPDEREPMFWLYSKGAIRERLHWLRNNCQWETPEDVSDEYKNHNDAEERTIWQLPSTGEDVVRWMQRKRRNDLFVCECYCAMILDMSGALGDAQIGNVQTQNETK